MPLERGINIAINGSFWMEVANPDYQFTPMLISCSPSMSAQRWLSEHHVFNSVFWPKSRFTKYKLNIRSLNISQIEQTVNLTTVKRTIFKLNNGQFNIQHLPIEQIDIYQNCLILCSIDICWIDIDSIDICSIDMCPRMGASPQTPWLCGASAPLRSPPGGAWEHCWYPP